MPVLTEFVRGGLYVLMGISALAAVAAVTLPHLFHAALALTITLLGVAGLFLAMHADFLAVAQILLYVGAVMTLIVFAIMLTENMGQPGERSRNHLGLPALAVSIILFMALFGLMRSTPWPVQAERASALVDPMVIGTAFMTDYVFPFEVVSVFLIAALIGAVAVARKEKP
jgi:NAD(P)H-quinone oxidoreductase subunit 6